MTVILDSKSGAEAAAGLFLKEYCRIFETETVPVRVEIVKEKDGQEAFRTGLVPPKEPGGVFLYRIHKKTAEEKLQKHRTGFAEELAYAVTEARFLEAYAVLTKNSDIEKILGRSKAEDRMFCYWLAYKARFYSCYYIWKYQYKELTDENASLKIREKLLPEELDRLDKRVKRFRKRKEELSAEKEAAGIRIGAGKHCLTAEDEEGVFEIMDFLGRLGGWREAFPADFNYKRMYQMLDQYYFVEKIHLLVTGNTTLPEMMGQFGQLQLLLRKVGVPV